MNTFLLALWYVMIATRLFCLIRIINRKLAPRYPVLTATLAAGTLQSFALIYALWTAGQPGYLATWLSAQPLTIGLRAALAIEVLVRICYHFQGIRWFGLGLASLLGCVAIGISAATGRLIPAGWEHAAAALVRAGRYEALALFAFLCMLALFFMQFPRVRSNVLRHLIITTTFFGTAVAAGALIELGRSSYGHALAYQLFSVGGSLLCFGAWSLTLTPAGEQWSVPERLTPEAVDAIDRQYIDLGRRVRALAKSAVAGKGDPE